MKEYKLLALFIQLKINQQSTKKYLPILSKLSASFQIITVDFLKTLTVRPVRKFADFRMLWKKNFNTFSNVEAFSIRESLADIKTEWYEVRALSMDALYENLHEILVEIGLVNIASLSVDDNADSKAILQTLITQVTALKDLHSGDISVHKLDVSNAISVQQFEQNQAILKQTKKDFVVSTGFPTLDTFLDGGQKSRQIGLIIALPKRYKTTLSFNFLISAFIRGYNVLKISFEDTVEDSKAKLEKIISLDKLQRIRRKHNYNNYFEILYYPPHSYTLSDFRSNLENKLKTNSLPHIVVLDFLDLMGFEEKFQEDYLMQNKITYGLKAIVNEFNIFLWAISQSKREGASANSIQTQHVARDWSRIAGVDGILSLNQSKFQKLARILSINLLDGRNTDWSKLKSDKLLLQMQPGCLRFKEITPEEVPLAAKKKNKNIERLQSLTNKTRTEEE